MLWIDNKYALLISPKLDRFKRQKEFTYNFRCPFCGDSARNQSKARGYLYPAKQKLRFKCHNCNLPLTFGTFLEAIDLALYKQYSMERFREGQSSTYTPIEEQKFPDLKSVNIESACAERVDFAVLQNSDHPAAIYLRSRMIPEDRWKELWHIDNMSDLVNIAPEYDTRLKNEPRLLIPYYSQNGILIGVSGRSYDSMDTQRYVTVKFNPQHPLIYNLNHIKAHETVYVTEGAFDSMFLHNCAAAGSTDLDKVEFKNRVLIYDNQPRNRELVGIMQEAIYNNERLVIWPEGWKYKDINEAIVDGVSQEEVQKLIYTNTFTGLMLNLKFQKWSHI